VEVVEQTLDSEMRKKEAIRKARSSARPRSRSEPVLVRAQATLFLAGWARKSSRSMNRRRRPTFGHRHISGRRVSFKRHRKATSVSLFEASQRQKVDHLD